MSGRPILVIEDNEQNLYLVRFLLEKNGYEVVEARDGQTGLELAKRLVPAAIILDIQLPVMTGYAVATALRERQAGLAVSRLRDLVPVLLEQEPDEIEVLLVVLDDQDGPAAHGRPPAPTGMRKVKTLPTPNTLVKSIAPPSRPRSLRQIDSPRPVPSCVLARPMSTCWKGRKRIA